MYAAVDREQLWLFRRYDSFSLAWRRSGFGSGGDIGHQHYKEFGAG
jgi:hypothetical protein